MKTFRQFLAEKDNRGGARRASLTAPSTLKPAAPAKVNQVLHPDNIMPRPAPITGNKDKPFLVKRPPNTTLQLNKK